MGFTAVSSRAINPSVFLTGPALSMARKTADDAVFLYENVTGTRPSAAVEWRIRACAFDTIRDHYWTIKRAREAEGRLYAQGRLT